MKDNPDRATVGWQRIDDIVADNDTSFGLRDKARDDAQQRSLPAAGRTKQGDDFTALHVEIDIFNRDRSAGITVRDRVKYKRTPARRFSHGLLLPISKRKQVPCLRSRHFHEVRASLLHDV